MVITKGKARIQLSFLERLKVNKESCQKTMLITPFLVIRLAGLIASLNTGSYLIKELLLYGGFALQLFAVLFLIFQCTVFWDILGILFLNVACCSV